MGARPGRVAHVVEAVEEADEVVGALERGGGGDLELCSVGQAGVGGALAGLASTWIPALDGVEAPWPQPTSATRAPAASLASTPSRAGIQVLARLLM